MYQKGKTKDRKIATIVCHMKKENLTEKSSHEHTLEKEVNLKMKTLKLNIPITFYDDSLKSEKKHLFHKLIWNLLLELRPLKENRDSIEAISTHYFNKFLKNVCFK